MSTPRPPRGIEYWNRELAENQMPAFAQTAQSIASKAEDEAGSAAELAKVILQDVSMTTRVLRMANSIHFNPYGGKINTVSRAIILLGFNVVRDMCVSISFIDTFLGGSDREMVVDEMARSFHAAMQAKRLAELAKEKAPEEIFIATLLYHLGQLAFWCFAERIDPDSVARLRQMLSTREGSREEVEREVLGFRLDDLTALLNKTWGLSPLLAASLDPYARPNPRTRMIALGHELARGFGEGADSPALLRTLPEVGKLLDVPVEEAREEVLRSARAAADTIARLGAIEAAQRIASTDQAVSAAIAAGEPLPEFDEPDPQLQMDILRELSQLLLEGRLDINLLLQMVMEGLCRGVGMDRAAFALLTPDRSTLRAKFVLGHERELAISEFVFPLIPADANPLARAMTAGEPAWIGGPDSESPRRTPDSRLKRLCGGQCLVIPLSVAGKPIGLLYADRHASGRAIDEELFNQFKLFGQQARMGLAYLKGG